MYSRQQINTKMVFINTEIVFAAATDLAVHDHARGPTFGKCKSCFGLQCGNLHLERITKSEIVHAQC